MDKQQAIYVLSGVVAISLLCLTVIFPAIDKRRHHTGVYEEEGTVVQQKVVPRQNQPPQEAKSPSDTAKEGTVVQQKVVPQQNERPQEAKTLPGAAKEGTVVQQKVTAQQNEHPQEAKSPSGAAESEIPEFQITGRNGNQLAVLVPQNTTAAELEKLIFTFKKAREENHLGKYFPPTTPNDKRGKYAIIGIYVFSDKSNATASMLKQYLSTNNVALAQSYAEGVLAYYYYGVPEREFGCLGLVDSKIKPTKKYKRLFSRNYPW